MYTIQKFLCAELTLYSLQTVMGIIHQNMVLRTCLIANSHPSKTAFLKVGSISIFSRIVLIYSQEFLSENLSVFLIRIHTQETPSTLSICNIWMPSYWIWSWEVRRSSAQLLSRRAFRPLCYSWKLKETIGFIFVSALSLADRFEKFPKVWSSGTFSVQI